MQEKKYARRGKRQMQKQRDVFHFRFVRRAVHTRMLREARNLVEENGEGERAEHEHERRDDVQEQRKTPRAEMNRGTQAPRQRKDREQRRMESDEVLSALA